MFDLDFYFKRVGKSSEEWQQNLLPNRKLGIAAASDYLKGRYPGVSLKTLLSTEKISIWKLIAKGISDVLCFAMAIIIIAVLSFILGVLFGGCWGNDTQIGYTEPEYKSAYAYSEERPFTDANKDYIDDHNMCWAATG